LQSLERFSSVTETIKKKGPSLKRVRKLHQFLELKREGTGICVSEEPWLGYTPFQGRDYNSDPRIQLLVMFFVVFTGARHQCSTEEGLDEIAGNDVLPVVAETGRVRLVQEGKMHEFGERGKQGPDKEIHLEVS
jgi:hypothetical protein